MWESVLYSPLEIKRGRCTEFSRPASVASLQTWREDLGLLNKQWLPGLGEGSRYPTLAPCTYSALHASPSFSDLRRLRCTGRTRLQCPLLTRQAWSTWGSTRRSEGVVKYFLFPSLALPCVVTLHLHDRLSGG